MWVYQRVNHQSIFKSYIKLSESHPHNEPSQYQEIIPVTHHLSAHSWGIFYIYICNYTCITNKEYDKIGIVYCWVYLTAEKCPILYIRVFQIFHWSIGRNDFEKLVKAHRCIFSWQQPSSLFGTAHHIRFPSHEAAAYAIRNYTTAEPPYPISKFVSAWAIPTKWSFI